MRGMLSKATLIQLRAAALALVAALDRALWEGYGWTARASSARLDGCDTLEGRQTAAQK